MSGFRKLTESLVYEGTVVRLARARFEAPDGSVFERDVVHHPGAVVVVPLLDDGRALLVRQYRAAIEQPLLELPAGKRDVAGEPPEVTAARELAEEVGRRPGRLDLLARFYNSPGFSDELSWLFLARDLEEVDHDRQGIEEHAMTLEEVPLAAVPSLIRAGQLIDAKTIIGLTLAAQAVA
ncbi:MAG: NUDIX hydrolase [Acidimicrobiaceae bacterium]|nr:NUDIX hydrolase [Acidimicrobiaceae bacterium]